MQLNPYLVYNDNCEAALKFYEKALGAKIETLLRNEEAPADMASSPERKKKVMHASISIDGEMLLASDAPPELYREPRGFWVCLTFSDMTDAERKFKALSEGGNVKMPFGKTFFAKGFGMCQDQFGVPWIVNCPLEG